MARSRAPARELPQGVTLCGFCDEFEHRAQLSFGYLRRLIHWARVRHRIDDHDGEGGPCGALCDVAEEAAAFLERIGESTDG